MEHVCHRCDGTGFITVRCNYPMSYVGPGSPPEYAKNVTEARCDYCDPIQRFQDEVMEDGEGK